MKGLLKFEMKLTTVKILIPKVSFFLLLTFFLTLVSCEKQVSNPLLGTWLSADSSKLPH